jgi:hypothetical protein
MSELTRQSYRRPRMWVVASLAAIALGVFGLVAGTHLTAVAVFAVAGGAFALILHLLMPNG